MHPIAPTRNTASPLTAASAEAHAWLQSIERVVLPLARLAVAEGLPFAVVEAQLKQAFAQAACEAHAQSPVHDAASPMPSTHRANQRERTQLRQVRSSPPQRRPVADELFAHWANDLACQDHHFSVPDVAMFR